MAERGKLLTLTTNANHCGPGRPRPTANSAAAQSALTFRARWRLRSLPARQKGLGQQQRHGQDEPRGQRHSLHCGIRHGCVLRGPGVRTGNGTGTATHKPAHTRPPAARTAAREGQDESALHSAKEPQGGAVLSQQQASIS